MVFSAITDGITRQIEGAMATVSGAFFEPVLRLGVTGLSRSGKTVFITGLVANLLDRGRMPQLKPAPRIEAVHLQPQPDVTLPRFGYEDHLAAMTGDNPRWPASTRAVSELRLSFRLSPYGLLAGVSGPRTLHVDIVDYPGEWLLDLALIGKTYADWSETTLDRIAKRPEAAAFMAQARAEDGGRPREATLEALGEVAHRSFRDSRPRSPNRKERIQKRATTLVEAQPFFWKWWWIGVIRNRRRPPVRLK